MISNYGRLAVAAILALISVWFLCAPSSSGATILKPIQPSLPRHFKPHGIENLGLTANLTTIVLQAVSTSKTPKLVEDVDVSLSSFALWDGKNSEEVSTLAPTNVRLPPVLPRVDASAIIFGVATTLDRLDDSLDAFAHWASGTGTTIVAVLPSFEEGESSTISPSTVIDKAASLGFNLHIYTSPNDYIARYMLLLSFLHDQATENTKWASIIDDDTFFPSISRLLTMLSHHDASKPAYIGGMSEDLYALQKWGYLAFGGAGIFLSMPLLLALQPHLETCATFSITSGDGKLAECIYKFTTTKLAVESGLHQLDLFGDFSGIFEAVRPLPTSVHHWKSWSHHDMVLTGKIAKITGEDSVLQKFRLKDGWWMTHGFSIVKYSDEEGREEEAEAKTEEKFLVSHRDGGMERTWSPLPDETEKTFMHSLEPIRPRDEGKVQYVIESAVQEDEHMMSLYYVCRKNGVRENEAESVIRVVWLKSGT